MSTKTEHNFVREDPLVEGHIRQLFETLPGMINICSATGQLEYVNREILELLGVPFEDRWQQMGELSPPGRRTDGISRVASLHCRARSVSVLLSRAYSRWDVPLVPGDVHASVR